MTTPLMEQALQALEELADEEERWAAEGLRSIAREALALCRQQAAEPAEPLDANEMTEDQASRMHFRGNSVSFVYAKKDAYGLALDRSWQALSECGFGSDGNTRIDDMIRRAVKAYKQDGERYRHLRDKVDYDEAVIFIQGGGADMDAAIDDDMAATQAPVAATGGEKADG